MNEEIKKLRQKIRSIDKKISEKEEAQVEVADDKSKTVSVTVPVDNSKPATTRGRGRRTSLNVNEARDMESDEADETFDLDFSKVQLTDADIESIIKNASDKPAKKSRGGSPTKQPATTREITTLGLNTSPAPKVVLTRTQTDDGEMWKIVEQCDYKTDSGVTITVPKGFITDLASVPRVFWAIVASFELSLSGPLFHDLIYRCAGQVPNNLVDPDHVFARDETDALFLELMEKSGVSFWKRRVAFRAVRTFAQFAWKNIGVVTQD